jgi:polysaccharide deacetylase family sporulation protein PdaB
VQESLHSRHVLADGHKSERNAGTISEDNGQGEDDMGVRWTVMTSLSGLGFLLMLVSGTATVQARQSDTSVIRKVVTDRKIVALTFDDGPSATFTPQILSILKRYHAKATFFVIGARVKAYPDLVRQEFEDGNEIANHSYRHLIMTQKPPETIENELENTQQTVESVLRSKQPRVFRPPRGRIDHGLLRVSQKKEYAVVLWSIDSRDWADPGVNHIVRDVLSRVGNGDIILLHDQGGNRKQTVEAVKRLVPLLQSRGYEFVTVSELLGVK